jgi:hypothetical protein
METIRQTKETKKDSMIYLSVFSGQKSFRSVAPHARRPCHPHSSDPRYGVMEGQDRRCSLSTTTGNPVRPQ